MPINNFLTPVLMELGFSFTKRLLPLLFNPCKQGRLDLVEKVLPLNTIGYDAIVNVVSFLDGESKYNLACTNNFFLSSISHSHNWEYCIIDLQVMSLPIIISLFKRFGPFISVLELRGFASAALRECLYHVIHTYCVHLKALNTFHVPYLISVTAETTSFAISFPSCVSDYCTLNALNSRNMMYSPNDSIVQSMELHQQDVSSFHSTIWQFTIRSNLHKGYSVSFQCSVNDFVVGTFSIEEHAGVDFYHINMLFEIPPEALSNTFRNLTLSLRCTSKLPFGAGFVTVTSIGRVYFVKNLNTASLVESTVPPFVDPSF